MRNNGKGGMCTSRNHNSIYCPFCGKPAFSAEIGATEVYKHFTKSGTVSHIKDINGNWKRKRGLSMKKQVKNPMPTVTYQGNTYKLRSRKTEVPDLESMNEFAALIWLNQNTTARGYSKAPDPLIGMGGAIRVN